MPNSIAKANYERPCTVCDAIPTVDVYDIDSSPTDLSFSDHTDLCGPCCFGEASAIDPAEWETKTDD